MSDKNRPRVGIGVIVENGDKILIGKRKGDHAPFHSIPGGHLELGESFKDAAIREIKEEVGVDILDPEVIAVTNNLRTYQKEGKHYISIILLAKNFKGEIKNMEPERCEGWLWADPHNLPLPHFDASVNGVSCYLDKKFHKASA